MSQVKRISPARIPPDELQDEQKKDDRPDNGKQVESEAHGFVLRKDPMEIDRVT